MSRVTGWLSFKIKLSRTSLLEASHHKVQRKTNVAKEKMTSVMDGICKKLMGQIR
jgi:hypothetical protein